MVGRRLAHYEIKEHLGSGGMGDVYRAIDTKLDRSVALKFVRADVAADPARIERFRREAKALAALNHPHIAAIYGQEDAIYFMAPDGKLMAATVSHTASTLTIGTPMALFATRISGQTFTYQYVVSRDGRFLVGSRQVEQASAPPITVIQNWKPD